MIVDHDDTVILGSGGMRLTIFKLDIKGEKRRKEEWRKNNPEKVHAARALQRANRTTEFSCVDGEGQTGGGRQCDCDHYMSGSVSRGHEICQSCGYYRNAQQGKPDTGHVHDYVLLGVGDEQVSNLRGLDWEEILEFLYSQYKEYVVYAGFFLSYDFTQWFKGIPKNKAVQLLTQQGIQKRKYKAGPAFQYHPVKIQGKRKAGEAAETIPAIRLAIKRGDLDSDTPMVWELHLHADRRLLIRPKICCKTMGDQHNPFADRPLAYSEIAVDNERCDVGHTKGVGDPGVRCDVGHTKGVGDPGVRCVRVKHEKGAHIFEGQHVSCPKADGMYINDAGGFFQTSFLKVIEPTEENWADDPICSVEEYEQVAKGKEDRSGANLSPEMMGYNSLENIILARLLKRYDDAFREEGIVLGKNEWYGPGQVAAKWLEPVLGRNFREVTEQIIPPEVMNAGRQSYYGGWFEIFAHGIVSGTSWEYDICSAYPHVISQLPCLLHSTWKSSAPTRPRDGLPRIGKRQLRLVKASVWGDSQYIGAMLHRGMGGSILRPTSTRGWFWQHELEAAQRAGIVSRIECYEWHTLYFCDETQSCGGKPPLEGIRDLYEKRRKAGKGTALGKALKLIINSIYGKFAQSIGDPPFANPIYASLITAGCRVMILDAIATHPNGARDVLMVATDGVYFRTRHPGLTISKNLGEWEEGSKENLCLFKPGVYWDDAARDQIKKGVAPQFKSRGVSAKEMSSRIESVDAKFRAWDGVMPEEKAQWPSAMFPLSFSMTSAKQAIRGVWEHAGLVTDRLVTHSSWPGEKRLTAEYGGISHSVCGARVPYKVVDGIYRSKPHYLKENAEGLPQFSMPYNKAFGVTAMYEDGRLDVEEYGLTPDGLVKDVWYQAMQLRG